MKPGLNEENKKNESALINPPSYQTIKIIPKNAHAYNNEKSSFGNTNQRTNLLTIASFENNENKNINKKEIKNKKSNLKTNNKQKSPHFFNNEHGKLKKIYIYIKINI